MQNWVLYTSVFTERTLAVITCGCESWTMKTSDESRIEAFEMKGLRRALSVSWTPKQGNVLGNLLSSETTRKLVYFGHVGRHNCLEKDVIPGIYREPGTVDEDQK